MAEPLHSKPAPTPPTAAGHLDVIKVSKAVGDPLRANILRALAQDSFAVAELGRLFDMAQPAISHHLKTLSDAGLVVKRREGTSIYYQRLLPPAQAFVVELCNELDQQGLPATCVSNLQQIYQQRLLRSQQFFRSNADALAQQTELICAPSVYADAVVQAAVQQLGQKRQALEVGPGDGTVLARLSQHFQQVTAVDNAGQMLRNSRAAVAHRANVQLLETDFFHLPDKTRFDLVVASMVVHHSASPAAFFRQAAQVLGRRGTLVIAELCAHDQDWVKTACGDVWLGFAPEQLQQWAQRSGFRLLHQQFLAQRNGFRVQVHTYFL